MATNARVQATAVPLSVWTNCVPFSPAFFEQIRQNLTGNYCFFHALHNGAVISSDLVLFSNETLYFFLSGSLEESFPLGASYLLKHHIALWAQARGKQHCVLGGGYAPGDGLFRYKRAFAKSGQVPFQTAGIIHNAEACRELIEIRHVQDPHWQPRPGFFPPYRA